MTIIKEFRLSIWGLAPKGSLKYRKGKEIESFILEVEKRAYERGYNQAQDDEWGDDKQGKRVLKNYLKLAHLKGDK